MNKSVIGIVAVVLLAGCTSTAQYQPPEKAASACPEGAEIGIEPLDISEHDAGAETRISLLNFNSGGEYFGGSKQAVIWRIEGECDEWDMVELLVSRDSGRNWVSIGRVPAPRSQVAWTLPTTEGTRYRIMARVTRGDEILAECGGEADFAITCGLPPCLPVVEEVSSKRTVTVTHRIVPGHTENERAITPEDISKVVLWVTRNDGETWENVGAFPASEKGINYSGTDGRYGFSCAYATRDGSWSETPASCSAPSTTLVIDTTPPQLEIRSPAEGEEILAPENDWQTGARVHIMWDIWDANLCDESVSIFVSQSDGEWRSLGSGLAAGGLFETRLPPSDRPYILKIAACDIAGNETSVQHRRGFTVAKHSDNGPEGKPTLTLVRCYGGEVLRGGSDQTVSWKSTGLPENAGEIIAEFYDGETWHEIRRLSDTCGTFVWRVPEINSRNCRLRLGVDLKYKTLTAQGALFTIDSAPPSADILPGLPEIEDDATPSAAPDSPAKPEAEQHVPARGPRVMDTGSIIEVVIKIEGPLEAAPGRTAASNPTTEDSQEPEDSLENITKTSERLEKRAKIDKAFEYMEQEKWTMAEVTLRVLLNKYPDDPEVLYGMGRLYYAQHRYEEAGKCFSRAVAIDPANAGAQYYLGKIALLSDAHGITEQEVRFIRAETRFKEAIENDPTMAEAHNDLATLYFGKEMYEDALGHFGRAVDADPANKIYLYNYGRTAYELKKYEDAVDFCLKATKIDELFPQPYWFIAKSYSSQKKWDKAETYWRKVIDLFVFDKRLQAEAVRRLKEAQEHHE